MYTPTSRMSDAAWHNSVTRNVNLVMAGQGWLPVDAQFVYASASSVSVPSDARLKYQSGDKLRLVQGGVVLYAYIVTVAATLLTLIVDAGSPLTNVAITEVSYSRDLRPWGFPDSFGVTTAFSGSGSPAMTYTDVTYNLTRFHLDGRQASWTLSTTGTIDNRDTDLKFILPVAAADANSINATVQAVSGGTVIVPLFIVYSSSLVALRIAGSWANASGERITATKISWEIA